MQLVSYLQFSGNCEAAFKFYEKCLGGKIEGLFPYGDSGAAGPIPAGWENKIMHATLLIGDAELMGADTPPDRYSKPHGFSVAIQIADTAEAERIFHALSEGATITVPIAATFWAARFGMLVDRFGIPWMVNCGQAT